MKRTPIAHLWKELSNPLEGLEKALHRYDPPSRVDASDLLIERMSSEREKLYSQMMSEEDESLSEQVASQAA